MALANLPFRACLILLLCTAAWAEQTPFQHPGMYVDNDDLAFVRAKITAKAEPWNQAYVSLISRVDRGYNPHAIANVYEGNGSDGVVNPPAGAEDFCKDAEMAYDFALAWALSGKQSYAAASITILNAWSSTLKTVTGGNSELRIGWAVPHFCNAAELLRSYTPPGGNTSAWAAADITRFKGLLNDVFYPIIKRRIPQIAGNNWSAVIQTAVICIGVFCDDHAKFTDVTSHYIDTSGNGFLPNYIYENGQCQESGRDQNHPQMGLAGMAGTCEIAWKQGVDLYGALSNRLAAGYEYQSKYNLGYDVPFHAGGVSNLWTTISSTNRGSFLTIYELPYRHYVCRKGIAMPFTKQVLDQHRRPEDFVGVGCIVLSRGTLTFYRGDAPFATAPTITRQPASTTVKANEKATFSITASGTPGLKYTWQKNGVDINGATSASYTTPAVSVSDSGATFRCTVSNSAGTVTSNLAMLTVTASVSGHGWSANYFASKNFTGTPVTRVDPTINFQWGSGSPVSGIGTDAFSVRWRGMVTPAFSQTYTFTTTCDDGVRLWVNGQLIVDRWVNQSATAVDGYIALTAGVAALVVMEYYENSGGASAQLEWHSVSQAHQIIPDTVVLPAAPSLLPGGWIAQDLGDVGKVGSTSISGETWIVTGSGADIWGSADAGQFVWQKVTDDLSITARVVSLSHTNDWAKAGVMVRESLAAGSQQAFTCLTPTNGLGFQRRTTTNSGSSHTAGPAQRPPYWVRLERIGTTLIGSCSADGNTWSEIRRVNITMGATVYVGLAVTSHANGTIATAQFTNVQVIASTPSTN